MQDYTVIQISNSSRKLSTKAVLMEMTAKQVVYLGKEVYDAPACSLI